MRPVCKACNKNQAAANYWRDGVRHYRSRCESCIRKDRQVRPAEPRWRSRGYVKKTQCDQCGFRAKYSSQITVWHIDGNLNNSELINLKSICLNCIEVVKRRTTTWRIGEIEVDS
jgi:hypothetical protein